MLLNQLEPQFIKRIDDTHWQEVDNIQNADGIEFVCPVCLKNNNMHRPGVHSIICWEPNVPQSMNPKPGRWYLNGTGYNDLTLKGLTSDSVLLTGDEGCKAHFFITNGEIIGT